MRGSGTRPFAPIPSHASLMSPSRAPSPPPCAQAAKYLQQGQGPTPFVSEADSWWRSAAREPPAHVRVRAELFLAGVFDTMGALVVVVVTHGSFIRELTAAVGLKPYNATPGQLLPLVIQDRRDPNYPIWNPRHGCEAV